MLLSLHDVKILKFSILTKFIENNPRVAQQPRPACGPRLGSQLRAILSNINFQDNGIYNCGPCIKNTKFRISKTLISRKAGNLSEGHKPGGLAAAEEKWPLKAVKKRSSAEQK
jgi:hypothetical protein